MVLVSLLLRSKVLETDLKPVLFSFQNHAHVSFLVDLHFLAFTGGIILNPESAQATVDVLAKLCKIPFYWGSLKSTNYYWPVTRGPTLGYRMGQ